MSGRDFAPTERPQDRGTAENERMQVRLTQKSAEMLNGVDLRHCLVGDVIEVSRRDALILLSEGWATALPSGAPGREHEQGQAAAQHTLQST